MPVVGRVVVPRAAALPAAEAAGAAAAGADAAGFSSSGPARLCAMAWQHCTAIAGVGGAAQEQGTAAQHSGVSRV
jgi:hypothetical protein